MRVLASAPAKIILFGEHSVVYGKPAIAAAIDLRTYVKAEFNENGRIRIEAKDIRTPGLTVSFSEDQIYFETDYGKAAEVLSYVREAINLVMEEAEKQKGVTVSITSQIPVGAGLGSSAAVAVATIGAVSRLFGLELTPEEVAKLGHKVELLVQGASSGIDPTVSAIGGFLYYQKGSFESLPVVELPIVVGYTGSSGSTKELVAKVRKNYEEMPEIIDPILNSMGRLVEKAREVILAEYDKEIKFKRLGTLMNINHGLLDALGVSTKSLSDLVYASREAGALGAKITGAGGGGCMYALAPEKQSEVATAIKIAGGMPIVTKISREGLRIEDIVQ
ncbi:MAG TPA: mevalonate kinase [Thermococcaceae archaeon]|uniref:Mevalonate kinase n=2 Tax=Thermococcus sibiricus TaxID=172049 RepID=MVK_THESM|nr:mevalonate kinase [Thermococcus sibiricus]C6A3T5.1 RecName: Full=Mevalonate kinase; Short=MK; Short=MVK [Thermococcus sibiricus MM 739]KUK28600.1 MAG: Mevalonate kinase [Thermococcus sp. 40_45]HII67479.1 mevalonate kinase [Thermococcaceae archaeon]ACS90280.1 Mevalonate kinase [Thermococcus sibiricus MM 739]KUK17110.1 MAG: Mevalonate kinase [Thermococcus sibiricus]